MVSSMLNDRIPCNTCRSAPDVVRPPRRKDMTYPAFVSKDVFEAPIKHTLRSTNILRPSNHWNVVLSRQIRCTKNSLKSASSNLLPHALQGVPRRVARKRVANAAGAKRRSFANLLLRTCLCHNRICDSDQTCTCSPTSRVSPGF